MKFSRSVYTDILRAILTFAFILTMFTPAVKVGATFLQDDVPHSVVPPELLQFTSAGHALGFDTGGVYLATGSYMLREEFVGTQGAAPFSNQAPGVTGQTQPLNSVSYPDLWEGITLVYDSPPGGILRSTYQVTAGSDPNQIALHYNAPVHLDGSGSLAFAFETGTLSASAPIAWQEIDGARVPVEAAFQISRNRAGLLCSGKLRPCLAIDH